MNAIQNSFLLLIALVAANLPFLISRIFFVWRPHSSKNGAWRLLEIISLYFAVGLLARVLEFKMHGDVYPQAWEFYVITFCLFLVLAFPGFVWCCLCMPSSSRKD